MRNYINQKGTSIRSVVPVTTPLSARYAASPMPTQHSPQLVGFWELIKCQKMRKFALKHFLPLGLVLAILVGLIIPQIGAAFASVRIGNYGVFQTLFVFVIFIITGLTLKTDDIKKALKAWQATLFGVTSILFITPLLALVPQHLPFLPTEFQIGFLLFCTMPTTINSGVALANAAKGNFALRSASDGHQQFARHLHCPILPLSTPLRRRNHNTAIASTHQSLTHSTFTADNWQGRTRALP